jgi:hypothetical protein
MLQAILAQSGTGAGEEEGRGTERSVSVDERGAVQTRGKGSEESEERQEARGWEKSRLAAISVTSSIEKS